METRYQVIDQHTGTAVGKPFMGRARARNRADELDLEYGAIRYYVRPVPVPTPEQKKFQQKYRLESPALTSARYSLAGKDGGQ